MKMKYNKFPNFGPDKLLAFIKTVIINAPVRIPDCSAMGLKK
jgi:hypothetical protein